MKCLVQNTFKLWQDVDLIFVSERFICWRRNSIRSSIRKKFFSPFSVHQHLSTGSQTMWMFVPQMLLFYFVAQQIKKRARAGVEGREEQWDSFKTGKMLSVIGRKRKNKLLCATNAYSGGAKLHFRQQFCLFLPVPHTMETNLDHQYIFLPYGNI